ncbi:uncharacterized protein M421DRAFT_426873 [Didymella exigua CBS 183.55]|uniref:Opioid growth factor receptor (OGFr) conserved domain-containing protein n=1 Tax=Didymella exigua CBS 183.55 TaxID=1150837 RepID=A0A6A5R6W9_9PLEO|nr:uncharacterized protein M421DRAFT_426873 [Didymella exigua CBS 183.55]KAF1922476.1 hypothetical protein M421DRAFT_426873 [Didymella exigua CBS 183.55]
MASSKQSPIVRFYDPDAKAKDALGRTQDQILAWPNSQLENSHNYIQMLFPLPEGSPFNYAAPVIDLETMKTFRTSSKLRQRLCASFERMLTFYGFTTSIHPEPESEEKTDMNESKQPSTEEVSEPSQTISETGVGVSDAQAPAITTSESTMGKTTEATRAEAARDEPEASAPEPKPTSPASPLGYYVVRGPNFRKASRNWAVRMDHNHLRITRILRSLRVLGLQRECDAFFVALKRVYHDPAINIGPRSLDFWTRAVERPLYVAPDDEECDWLKAFEEREQQDAK